MRGHLQQRSRDSWRLKVYVGRSADGRKRYVERTVHGSRKRYVERTVHGSRRDAERELARLVVEVDEAATSRRRRAVTDSVGRLLLVSLRRPSACRTVVSSLVPVAQGRSSGQYRLIR